MSGQSAHNTLFHVRNNTPRVLGEFTYGDDFRADLPAIALLSGDTQTMLKSIVSVGCEGNLNETSLGHAIHASDAQLDLCVAIPVTDDPCFAVDQFHSTSPLFYICSQLDLGLYSCSDKLIFSLDMGHIEALSSNSVELFAGEKLASGVQFSDVPCNGVLANKYSITVAHDAPDFGVNHHSGLVNRVSWYGLNKFFFHNVPSFCIYNSEGLGRDSCIVYEIVYPVRGAL